MSFKPDEYIKAKTVGEVTALLKEHGEEAAVVAGGTELHELAVRGMVPKIKKLIDIEQLGLNDIKSSNGGVSIGAAANLSSVRDSSLFGGSYTAIAEAAKFLPFQIVERGTIGGDICAGLPILNFPPVIVALGAELKAVSAGGERIIPAGEFFVDYFLTALDPSELVTEIVIPPLPKGTGSVFQVFKLLSVDYPTVSVAVKVTLGSNETCEEVGIVFGSVGRIPVRATKAEGKLRGKKLEDKVIKEAVEAIPGELEPMSDLRASAEYRKEISKVVAENALIQARARITS
ncbi:FAD binding domain-containing protein [Chloroflexota bacterium]